MALKWGIMSTGKICNDFVNAINYLPDDEHQIVGVAARKKEKAKEFAHKHNIPIAFDCYEDLVKDKSIGNCLFTHFLFFTENVFSY